MIKTIATFFKYQESFEALIPSNIDKGIIRTDATNFKLENMC